MAHFAGARSKEELFPTQPDEALEEGQGRPLQV